MKLFLLLKITFLYIAYIICEISDPPTESSTGDLSVDTDDGFNEFPIENDMVAFNDYVMLNITSNYTSHPNLAVKVDYLLEEYNDFYITGVYYDSFGHKTQFYNYRFRTNQTIDGDDLELTGSISIHLIIPNELVYYNHQNISYPTNYFVSEILVEARLAITDLNDGNTVVSIDADCQNVTIPDPWQRLALPQYNLKWDLKIINMLNEKRIPKCSLLTSESVYCKYFTDV